LFSAATNNSFSLSDNFDKTHFDIKLKNFIMGAKQVIKEDKKGKYFLN